MTMWNAVRRRLALKLFLSYLAVVAVGMIVLAATVELAIPSAFERHMVGMSSMMGMMGSDIGMDSVYDSFSAGANEALWLAGLAASLAAAAASIFVSRQVVAPVQKLTRASRLLAEGRYELRVPVPAGSPETHDELARLAQAFNRMAGQLEQTEAMRRQLVGDVSHELRTPLTAIKGSLEALIDGVLPAEPETYHQIYREADRLQRLVDDLLELSRVEARAYELTRQPLAVADLFKTAIQRLGRAYTDKGVDLRVEPLPNLPQFQGDPDRLGQVLINLLANALQHTPTGGQVTLRARQAGGEIHVSVQDSGAGIPAEHLKHLFTRFYRVDKSRSRQSGGGSGIGLTIARHLVEAHGGHIWAESPGEGQGSTFTFSLPV